MLLAIPAIHQRTEWNELQLSKLGVKSWPIQLTLHFPA